LCVGGNLCDFTRAFDCVNHEILLAELHFYGIQIVSKDWFRSCLAKGRQKVEVTSLTSTQNFFSDNGMWIFPRINARASVVHFVYK
jgi:hypothetical protein